jgi:two-component system, OmpR family, phosphate regulon sensor histidine kinase PhoR
MVMDNSVKLSAEFERQRLVSLINSMGDGVVAVDEKCQIVLLNGAALNILDLNTVKPLSLLSDNLHLVDKLNAPLNVVDMVLSSTTATTSRDYCLTYPGGEKINLYLSISPVHLGYGHDDQKGFVVLLRDITREKSLEEERDEFISVVSHELRTPIAIAEGNLSNAQLIVGKSADTPDNVKTALKEAYNQITFLSSMVNDLATLSRAERNKLEVQIESINVVELVNELQHNYQPSAEKKGLKLLTKYDPSLALLNSSKLYVREILQNFITNSIKYTDTGSVTVIAEQKDKFVRFLVSDTGIGISKSDQEKVFDKFFRSEDFRTRKSSGTGLGLYVTMKLTRLIKADISLESELNKGSIFTIDIPNLS